MILFSTLLSLSSKPLSLLPAKRERELGSDRRETGYFHPVDEVDIETVIEASSRGTHRSDDDDDGGQ